MRWRRISFAISASPRIENFAELRPVVFGTGVRCMKIDVLPGFDEVSCSVMITCSAGPNHIPDILAVFGCEQLLIRMDVSEKKEPDTVGPWTLSLWDHQMPAYSTRRSELIAVDASRWSLAH
jgi:hypothetical protein